MALTVVIDTPCLIKTDAYVCRNECKLTPSGNFSLRQRFEIEADTESGRRGSPLN